MFIKEVRDLKIPSIGLGTYTLTGSVGIDATDFALSAGYRHIDTAQMYGNEREVGLAIDNSSVPRSEIFVTTKVLPDRIGKATFLPSVENSLKALGLNEVNLLLIHWPNDAVPLEESIGELVKAQAKGYTQHIGVSNFPSKMFKEAIGLSADIICNQVEYHLFLSQEQVLPAVQEAECLLTAYTPLARAKMYGNPIVEPIAEKYGKSAAQIGLRWLIQQKGVAAIPRSKTPANIQSNIEVFDFELNQDEMQALNELGKAKMRLIDPGFAPKWD